MAKRTKPSAAVGGESIGEVGNTDPFDNAEPIAGGDDSGGDSGNGDIGDGGTGSIETGDAPKRKGGWVKGRKRGPRKEAGSPGAAPKVSIDGIEGVLLSIHAMIAAYTGVPELTLTGPEGRALAEGIAGVAKFYPSVGLPPQIMAWTGLIAVASKIYVPRIASVRAKIIAKKQAAKNGQAPV